MPEHFYHKLFKDAYQEIYLILNSVFKSVLKGWGGGAILPMTEDWKARLVEDSEMWNPFCHYVRKVLGFEQNCITCDRKYAEIASKTGGPIDYWCHCGMRDIAVPIFIHGTPVAAILCGQKILEGPNDNEGERRLFQFVKDHLIEQEIETLLKKRKQTERVSAKDLQEMKRILWATSQYISQILYSKLDQDVLDQQTAQDDVNKFFTNIFEIMRGTNFHTFWSNYKNILRELSKLFDNRASIVYVTYKDQTKAVSHHRLKSIPDDQKIISASNLITSEIEEFYTPLHKQISVNNIVKYPVSARATRLYPHINLVLYGKIKSTDNKIFHFIIYFDQDVIRKNTLLLHEKKQILIQLMWITANAYSYVEQIANLKKTLKEKEGFLKDVAHQVRQPIHSIVAYCDNLLSPNISTEKKKKIPQYLRERARHGSILMKCIEYTARGESNIFKAEKIRKRNTCLTKMLIDFAITIQGYSKDENIQIHVEESKTNEIGIISVDRNKLEFAMSNILFNAVKYSFPGSTVNISAFESHDKKLLTITTNSFGLEIPESHRTKIFKRGVRTSMATQYSQSGLGIGLFVTREIMKHLGGDAYVLQSNPTGRVWNQYSEFNNIIAISLTNYEQLI